MFLSKKDKSDATPPEDLPCTLTNESAMDLLRVVIDPDLGLNIVDLGLVYETRVDADAALVDVDMTLTTPACPYGPQLIQEVTYVLRSQDGIHDVNVNIVWEPAWSMDNISESLKLELGLDL